MTRNLTIATPCQFLLIDDDRISNFVTSGMLHAVGIGEGITAVQTADDGLSYLEHVFSDSAPHVVIFLDLDMPLKSGFDFLKQFNRLHESLRDNVMIAMLSVLDRDSDRNLAHKLGARLYLPKPITVEALTNVMQTAEQHFRQANSQGPSEVFRHS